MVSPVPTNWAHVGYGLNAFCWMASVLLIVACFYVFLQQRKAKEYLRQREFRTQIVITRQCMIHARLTSLEIAALAVEAGMKAHDVFREYVNDLTFRKEIVERILGNSDAADCHDMAKKMIEKFPSRFVSHGYAQQLEFVTALPDNERLRPAPVMSIRLLPVLEVTKEKKSDNKSRKKSKLEKSKNK